MEIFADSFIPAGLEAFWFASRRCPSCQNGFIHRTRSLEESRWLCNSCGQCWRAEHGRLRAVDPVACHGCATRPKRECIELLQRKFRRFGAGAESGYESV